MTTTPRRTAPKKAPAKRAMPHRPAGVREPQDHKSPAQAEAEGDEYVEWEHSGVTYTAPGPDYVKGIYALLERGRGTLALEKLLGPEQYKAFLATDPFDREYGEMMDKWAEAGGLDSAGN